METLSRLWGSASTSLARFRSAPFVTEMSARMTSARLRSGPFVREWSARVKSGSLAREMSARFATFLESARALVHAFAYSARNTLIQWCLTAANHLQRAQAAAIARDASTRATTQGIAQAVAIPTPSYPNASQWYSPPPRVPFKLYTQPPPAMSGSISSPNRELRYDDFDDAPTAVYNDIPFDDAPTSVFHPIPLRRDARVSEHH